MSNLGLYLITVLIWGSTWFAIEFQLGVVEPEVSIVYRYVGASALLFAWSRFRGLNLVFGMRQHGWFVLLGLFLFGLNYVLAYRAQIYITSALTAIAFSSIVWMNIVNARIFFNVRTGRRVLFGSLLGVAGIVVLFAPQIGQLALTDAVLYGSILAVLGALIASFGNMVSQGAQKRALPIIQSNAWGMFYGAVLTGIIALVEGHPFVFDTSLAYALSLGYLTVFGSIIAFGAYLTLLGRIGAHRAGYAMVLFPVVALVLSTLFEGLQLDAQIAFGTLLVIAGNVFVLDRKTSRQETQRTQQLRDPA
ncbi:MAG: EamA family transporter [Gammaproteobacteria bacterium]|nr:EamA family transporter [Gammaproteobacteria bacterium]MDH3431431.1 EamA family transporter [Gammaproteobacteria bacterium]MDH3433626.1 EamA family transporter [Gammaproteobacteria bacterium]